MKTIAASTIFTAIFGVSFLQHGCENAGKTIQQPTSNQNSNAASTSPPQLDPTAIPSQNTVKKGASEEQVRDALELMERCKHAPIGKVKATPTTGAAPLKVVFDGAGSYDPDGTKIVKWEWHFGNGQSEEGKIVSYTYTEPGKYGIILNVSDS